MIAELTKSSSTTLPDIVLVLETAIKDWWASESADWDDLVLGRKPGLPGGADLWDVMPEVDSKAIARSSPIFEAYLGVPLDVKLIKRGGYSSIDEAVQHLVPKMITKVLDTKNA